MASCLTTWPKEGRKIFDRADRPGDGPLNLCMYAVLTYNWAGFQEAGPGFKDRFLGPFRKQWNIAEGNQNNSKNLFVPEIAFPS